jgi:asparagine synthetase B (glutamine-hydrolysing)
MRNERHAVWARVLSRNPDHVIQTFDDGRLSLAFFDNGAWERERKIVEDGDSVGVVSGNPLLADDDGVTNDPADGVRRVVGALASGDWTTLARPAGGFTAMSWQRSARVLRLCAGTLPQRPLYVRVTPEACYFATTLRMMRAMSPEPLRARDQGLAELLYFGRCLGKGTVLEGVDIVTHGMVVEVTDEGFQTRRYFDWNAIAPSLEDDDATARKLHHLFGQAVRRRLRGARTADAFLSGGLDTRCVIAGLLDEGVAVRAFTHAYGGSSDDVLSGLMAERFGIEHVAKEAKPLDRLKLNTDIYAFYAKRHFPRVDGDETRARIMWSGDWGSFVLGGGTGETESGRMAGRSLDPATLDELFGGLKKRITRSVRGMSRLRELAFLSAKREIETLNPAQIDRRLFLFYMLSDQNRILYDHYEEIDLSNVEFETPFYDFDFIAAIIAAPSSMIVGHRLYYKWMAHFKAPITEVPWQAYPGHLPCPLPMPEGLLNQWKTDWYGADLLSQILEAVTSAVLHDPDPEVWRSLDRRAVTLFRVANSAGVRRFGHESSTIRKVYEAITGRRIFPLP